MLEFQIKNYDKRMIRNFERADRELSKNNADLIKKYDAEMATLGLKKSTRAKQIGVIIDITIRIGKDWNQVTKPDIDALIRNVIDEFGDNMGGETETTRDYKKCLKPFYRWFKLGNRDYNEVGDPPELKSIHLKQVKDKILREQLLTDDDIKKLLDACADNARDRALFDVHYEAGTRPSEILNLKIKHVKFDDNGAVIHVDGKTGPRPIRIILSVPNLAKWFEVHPFRDNPEAPLWILFDADNYGQQMTYSAAIAMLKRRQIKAKIRKPLNLKLFRHSAATKLSKHLSESTMRLRHGWTKGSTMPSRYVHLNNSDVDEAILKMYGLSDSQKDKLPVPKKCSFCDVHNSPASEICYKCGRPLDLKKAIQIEEKASQEGLETKKALAIIVKTMLSQPQNLLNIAQNDIESLQKQLNL
ncbi:MAG: tyrosine recombinase XerC [Candidatus Nitrosotenuis sp.]